MGVFLLGIWVIVGIGCWLEVDGPESIKLLPLLEGWKMLSNSIVGEFKELEISDHVLDTVERLK